jgi:hypothetical protein
MFDLKAAGVIFLGRKETEEDGFHSAFAESRQVYLTVLIGVTDVTAQVKLAIDHVDVAVHDERAAMKVEGLAKSTGKKGQQHQLTDVARRLQWD